jgi:hypothetical protein
MFFSNNEQKIKKLGINIQEHLAHYAGWHSFSTTDLVGRTDIKKIQVLNMLLEQPSVNYAQINAIAKQIKNDKDLGCSKMFFGYMDNNIFRDLFASTYRIATSPFYFLALLATQPRYSYVAIQLLLEGTARLISTIIFPIAILYSKYKTDSYNVFKGDLSRMLDSTIALTEIEMNKQNASTLAVDYDFTMDDGSHAVRGSNGLNDGDEVTFISGF